MPSTDRIEFQKFHKKLMENAPKNYTPWYFPVQKESKAPKLNISWKTEQARLKRKEADKRLAEGKNVGIAGKPDDRLILVDIDDPSIEEELKPTLKIRSRSRTGTHAIYWAHPEDKKLPCNIPTDKGEVRSSDQYVVAPGSYVPCPRSELLNKYQEGEISEKQYKEIIKDPDKGRYTIDNDKKIANIKFQELPQVFIDHEKKKKEKDKKLEEKKKDFDPKKVESKGNKSALFKLEIDDIAPGDTDSRDSHPIHDSTTGANWSLGNSGGQKFGHCWRHLVSLNSIQFLCVQAGYLDCQSAGSPHSNGNAGMSHIIGDDQAIWEAWKEAKKIGAIPKDDPVPRRALNHIARKHKLCPKEKIPDPGEHGKLYWKVYYRAVEIIEEEY